MSAPSIRYMSVNGQDGRVSEKAGGEPLLFLAGMVGLPRWTPVLDRLAEQRRVTVPSLPGSPGGQGQDELDAPVAVAQRPLDSLAVEMAA